eukprot:CAMPEP_0174309252 /NCGR_PEP_ID=MMETSP0810-20121108/2286_1 /TAXON_ID=73025 ORGANISM="Eutreptiella gymnastica-like, Strain CCMP1594" /NCGR_SAMPLE_ID=MMETSP0810 /ASSEMBLY_ACC=CAM_ASM_000659 /LENGTH=59 /DNA_ID=CAMNT_0015416823 /DNA_START=1248 /DNA_END=1423 /DNA_ORIENTATION=-
MAKVQLVQDVEGESSVLILDWRILHKWLDVYCALHWCTPTRNDVFCGVACFAGNGGATA